MLLHRPNENRPGLSIPYTCWRCVADVVADVGVIGGIDQKFLGEDKKEEMIVPTMTRPTFIIAPNLSFLSLHRDCLSLSMAHWLTYAPASKVPRIAKSAGCTRCLRSDEAVSFRQGKVGILYSYQSCWHQAEAACESSTNRAVAKASRAEAYFGEEQRPRRRRCSVANVESHVSPALASIMQTRRVETRLPMSDR